MRSVDLRINQIESNGRAHVPSQEAGTLDHAFVHSGNPINSFHDETG
jgi:hypothetical protein